MPVIDEIGMLVQELRDDPAFHLLLFRLHDCIGRALRPVPSPLRNARFAELAERLVETIERLEAQR